jgi:osmotically-inducible protein OsmY
MSHQALRQDVIDELDFDPSVDSTGIGVAAENGVVTLTGHVQSYQQKVAAEQAAWRVKGVKAIAQELEVRLPNHSRLNDDELATRAVRILHWTLAVPPDAVQVKVTKGFVALTGKLEWQFQRSAAESAVRKITGVTGVVNLIELTPRVKAKDVRDRIYDALRRHADVEASHIQVDVDAKGAVVLGGHVDHWEERRAVENAAWSVPGVVQVRDNVAIY